MVQIVFLIETVAQTDTEVVGSAEMGHQSDVSVNVVIQLISGGDFLVDVAFAEVGEGIVFQVPAKLEVIRQPIHGHGITEVEVELGHLQGADIVYLLLLGLGILFFDVDAVLVDEMVGKSLVRHVEHQ